jgi:hypothetical protein
MTSMKRTIVWGDISSAPKGGQVVVTNDGTGKFYDSRWYLCSPCGHIPSCNEYGIETSEIDPTMWFEYPW